MFAGLNEAISRDLHRVQGPPNLTYPLATASLIFLDRVNCAYTGHTRFPVGTDRRGFWRATIYCHRGLCLAFPRPRLDDRIFKIKKKTKRLFAGRVVGDTVGRVGRQQKSERETGRRCGRGAATGRRAVIQAGAGRPETGATTATRGHRSGIRTAAGASDRPAETQSAATAAARRRRGLGRAAATTGGSHPTADKARGATRAPATAVDPTTAQGPATTAAADQRADCSDHQKLQQAQRRRVVHVRLRSGRRQFQGRDARHGLRGPRQVRLRGPGRQ